MLQGRDIIAAQNLRAEPGPDRGSDVMENRLPALEEPCPDCSGNGSIANTRDGNVLHFGGVCNSCRGAKWMPTEAGKQILELIRHERQKGYF